MDTRDNQRRDLLIKTLQGLVSLDGDIRGRMNAAPSANEPFSPELMQQLQLKAVEMRSRNLTPEQVEAEVLANFDAADTADNE